MEERCHSNTLGDLVSRPRRRPQTDVPPSRLSPAAAGLCWPHVPASHTPAPQSPTAVFPEDTGLSFSAPQEATPRSGVLIPEATTLTAAGPARHGGKRKQTGAWSPGRGTWDSREGGGGQRRPPGLGLTRGPRLLCLRRPHAGPGPLQVTRAAGLPLSPKIPGHMLGSGPPVVSQQRAAASPKGPAQWGWGRPWRPLLEMMQQPLAACRALAVSGPPVSSPCSWGLWPCDPRRPQNPSSP